MRMLIVLVSTLGWIGMARADVVMSPPDTCPPGATPGTGHSGPRCNPQPDCVDDAGCPGGRCTAMSQCIVTRGCGGRASFREPGQPPCTVEHVQGPCETVGQPCAGEHSTCRARRVCVPAEVTPPPQPPQPPPPQPPPTNTNTNVQTQTQTQVEDDGCGVAGSAARGIPLVIGLGALALALRARGAGRR